MQPTLLVLAAGTGSRYGGLKQIDPVGPNGEIIIDYSIYDAIRSGFGKVVFVIRKDIETEFRESVGKRFTGVIPVNYVFQDLADLPAGFSVPQGRIKPWGTGHAILAARDMINEPFAVINADDFYGRAGYRLLCNHLNSAPVGGYANYAMVGYVLRNTLSDHGSVSRGICECNQQGFVSRVVERLAIFRDGNDARFVENDGSETMVSGDKLVSLNFWGFTPSIFDHLESEFRVFLSEPGIELESEFFIPTVTGTLVEQGTAKVTMLESPDAWFGITYRKDKAMVTENIRKLVDAGIYPEELFP
jgi:UTP-glucose-1-phosphate uridylyltransferase